MDNQRVIRQIKLRACLDRIAPLRKGRPVPFELPRLDRPEDVTAASVAIVEAASSGELTLEEATAMFKIIDAFIRVMERTAKFETPSEEVGPTARTVAPKIAEQAGTG